MISHVNKLVGPVVLASLLLVATPSFAYTVKAGDTMTNVAIESNLTLQELAVLNPQVKDINLIYVGQEINTTKEDNSVSVTANEKNLLARLVEAEAKGEPYAGKVAVAVVVLNRVDSDSFPDTVTDVINQPYQFSPVGNGSIYNTPSQASLDAVSEALKTDRSLGKGSLFFYNSAIATSRWLDTKETTVVIGNHTFKK